MTHIKNRLNEIRKGEETYNQWRKQNIVNDSKQSTAVVAINITKSGETLKICKRKEVKREIMAYKIQR